MFYQHLYKRTTFFASKLNSPEGIHVGSHFVNEEQGRLVTYLIQSCRAQNVNTRGRFFFLQDFQTSFSITRTKRRVKICRIFLSFFLFLLISFSLSVCPSLSRIECCCVCHLGQICKKADLSLNLYPCVIFSSLLSVCLSLFTFYIFSSIPMDRARGASLIRFSFKHVGRSATAMS